MKEEELAALEAEVKLEDADVGEAEMKVEVEVDDADAGALWEQDCWRGENTQAVGRPLKTYNAAEVKVQVQVEVA